MSTMSVVPDTGDELPSQQVARRIRGLLAERQISGTTMASHIGLDQRAFSRRYRGVTAWSFDELSAIASALRISFDELTRHEPIEIDIEADSKNPRPGDPDGGDSRDVRHQGLEPRTRWLSACPPQDRIIGGPRPESPAPVDEPAARVVVPLSERRRTSNSAVRGSSRLATVTRISGSAS